MQWWMWVIAVTMVLVGLWIIFASFGGDAEVLGVLGLALIASAVLGSIYYQHWRPAKHRNHLRAVADTANQGFSTTKVSDSEFDLAAFAGNCVIPVERHKVNGVYRLEILKRIKLTEGATATVKVPIDKQFLADIGKLDACK